MEEIGCIHDLPLGHCGYCKEPPFGINKIVYSTKGGLAFHNSNNCETLISGQLEADSKGLDIHPIVPTGWAVAFASRRPCRNCCPDFKSFS
jgi:hypothetical protein